MDFSFPRSEHLKSRAIIEQLFKNGQGFLTFPFKVVWCTAATDAPLQVAFSVPKRNVKHAVVRNRLKRRAREAWRLHRHPLYEHAQGTHYALIFIYVGKEECTYSEMERAMKKAIYKLPAEWARGITFTQNLP